jgi:hypothetical protein
MCVSGAQLSYTKMFSLQCRGPAEGLDNLFVGVMLSLTFTTDAITVSKAKCHLFYPHNCRKLFHLLLKLEQQWKSEVSVMDYIGMLK